MDNEPPQTSKRGRIMGKLFGGRDRKASNLDEANQLNDFLHGPTDRLDVTHAGPPVLAKLDTRSASRYPNALTVNVNSYDRSGSQQSLPLRTHSPRTQGGGGGGGGGGRARRKGLVVSFVDTVPEIIGEGGDECGVPTVEIRKRRPVPPSPQPPIQQMRSPRRPPDVPDVYRAPPAPPEAQHPGDVSFNPTPLRRAQTGYSSILEPEPQLLKPSPQPPPPPTPRTVPAGIDASAQFLDSPVISRDENRRSFIETQQAQMREAEGLAFARAVRSSSATGQRDWEDNNEASEHKGWRDSGEPKPPGRQQSDGIESSPEQRQRPFRVDQSPASTYSDVSSVHQRQANQQRLDYRNGSPTSPVKPSPSLREPTTPTVSDEALREFAARTRHLFEIFRLHSEAVRPLSTCPLDLLARAALWWFIKGRMTLESAHRDQRPSSPEAQRAIDMLRQQANADLAKGYWISEEILPDLMAAVPESVRSEIEDVRSCLRSNLMKLANSMKRNNFLPPEDAILPQTLHLSIWVVYPQVSQDIMALLWGSSGGSALSSQQQMGPPMDILESLPVYDTVDRFCYGRVPAEVFLMEQGMESQNFKFPCLLSMVRPQNRPNLAFIVASQDGSVQLRIQNSKSLGPTWDDLRWHNQSCMLELRLPRGFLLRIKLSPADYKMLWNMYDFGEKVQATLFPRKDEQIVFQSKLKSFQYFDSDPQSRQFPKEAVPGCEVALFERVVRENAATGPRTHHRGFRIAVVTGPRSRTLSGVNHAFLPSTPTQFGFLRGEQETPALLLRFDNGRNKGSMVMSFDADRERLTLHSLLLGTKVHSDETKRSEVPLVGFTVSQRLSDADGLSCLAQQPWQRATVINAEQGGDSPAPTVLAEQLRVIMDFKVGTLTDRVNVAPGELRVRLDVRQPTRLRVLRPPQKDMTIAVSEAQVARELPRDLKDAIETIQSSPTIRTFQFASVRDLHDFQQALTGFRVLFDGVAAAFAIARRRMVVPIHKKWEAGATRIQVVQNEGVTQLLAFFDDFHHGHSMGFVLKGTDVFESISRGGKAGIKIDDAKFPLPRVAEEGAEPTNEMFFVCLDMPELPGEHDDITILFESENDRDQLVTSLPAPVRNSRLAQKFLKS